CPSVTSAVKKVKCFQGADEDLLLLPEKLQKRLLQFQREGVKFALSRDGRSVMYITMGLGKTVQAISVAYLYRKEWPLLIVVPSSLKYPWIEELERWVPELRPEDINLVESKADIMGISQSKVTVLGYGLLTTDARSLVEVLNQQRFGIVIVDEAHYLKSRNAARTKILVPVIQNAKRAILLTGTPALGRPEELFMQIDALYPRRFGTWSDYAKIYCNAHYKFFGNRRQWDCRGASNLDELHHRLSEIMIRRLKAEVLTQLPDKIRQRIPFDLPKEAGKEASMLYEKWERLMRSLDSGESSSENPFSEVMGLITQMYKQTAVAKAGAVKDYIKMMLETEQLKFLVFAHHLSMLQACTEAVIEAKAGYIRIDGSVPSAERIQLVHRFQNDPDTRVAILSIQAAGQGLTLTAASHVVFAELYWNPGHVKQAEDRAHRIGQTASVHVHYLIAKGTFDMVMWGMLNRKEKVTGSTLNGRKDYLKAEEGDKEKWDFLNFAQAWTPSDCTIADEDTKEGAQAVMIIPPSLLPPSSALLSLSLSFSFSLSLSLSLSFSLLANDGGGCNPVDDSLPVYDSLKFCASKNTDRIYIYDKDGLPLNCNFIPMDIRLQNWEDLPPEFSRTENRRQVVRFVREWSFLTAMKQKMVRKSGQVFSNPILLLDTLTNTNRRQSSTKRYLTKQDVAQTSISAAKKEGGTLRTISRDNVPAKRKSITKPLDQLCSAPPEVSVCGATGSGSDSGAGSGYVQALDSGGNPLCLSCQKPSTDHSGWAGGFCSSACMEEFQLRSNQSYMRARVLETEQGVCQHCGLHAHQLYLRVRDAPHTHRKELLDNTWLAQLPLKQLNEMIRNPVEGQFWQVDHIKPVYSGGGQCLLDNLQTLCTVCHRTRTSQQAKERSQMKKGQAASKLASDITQFFIKK
uniref:Zinc finger, RAN-binding domain containing 3 n=1 Tax=Astyanax mexicanus TaxID=7994 RepID=A0A8B9RM33_ASTMX